VGRISKTSEWAVAIPRSGGMLGIFASPAQASSAALDRSFTDSTACISILHTSAGCALPLLQRASHEGRGSGSSVSESPWVASSSSLSPDVRSNHSCAGIGSAMDRYPAAGGDLDFSPRAFWRPSTPRPEHSRA
jgi:hypothetical protein